MGEIVGSERNRLRYRRNSRALTWYIEPSQVAWMLPSAIALQRSASVGIRSDTGHLPTKCSCLLYRQVGDKPHCSPLANYTFASCLAFHNARFTKENT